MLWLRSLTERGRFEEAKVYAAKYGMDAIDQGGRGFVSPPTGSINSSTSADLNLKNITDLELVRELQNRGIETAAYQNGKVIPVVPVETPEEYEKRATYERTHLPEFKPAREVLPKMVRWAVVTAHSGVNRLLREIRFEDNNALGALWLTQRQAAKTLARKGEVVMVEYDDTRIGEAWKLWFRK